MDSACARGVGGVGVGGGVCRGDRGCDAEEVVTFGFRGTDQRRETRNEPGFKRYGRDDDVGDVVLEVEDG